MRDPAIKSYSAAMALGKPVTAVSVIGRVLSSAREGFKKDDVVHLESLAPTESYSVVDAESAKRAEVLNPPKGVPLTAYLGALGMTGMTAYGSLHEIGQPQKGQTILISAAAGAVGQMVGQFAVREGLKVYGSVGDDEVRMSRQICGVVSDLPKQRLCRSQTTHQTNGSFLEAEVHCGGAGVRGGV